MKVNKKSKIYTLSIIALLAMGLSGRLYFQKNKIQQIDSFEKCAAAGYPIMESYPEQCRVPNGKTYAKDLNLKNGNNQDRTICAMDVKICPNGAYVSRQAPDCAFEKCRN